MRRHLYRKIAAATALALFTAYMLCLPRDLFHDTVYSTVVMDRDGELLGARIAEDGQWRFPPSDSIPDRFAEALIEFEDRAFRWHPGVNPAAIARAAWQNATSGKVVSGGSTITMQVIRMSRGRKRDIFQKAIEAIMATRLELRCSKDEILAMYAAHAPFGGNVVGIEAASWRYFGRSPEDLSWSEAATLAVLPNSPALIHPGKNRDALKRKRDRLLLRLHEKGLMDQSCYRLACEEPLPDSPMPLPQHAPHLTEQLHRTAKGERTRTDISIGLQVMADGVAERWGRKFSDSGINDLAFVIIDVHTGKTAAYGGNTGFGNWREGSSVDVARSPRSTGSILKPLLYCAMLQEGQILPNTLLADTPVNINGFSPQNFDRKFYGAVPASEALTRSLNVPSVHSLREYGVQKFHELLKKAGMTTLTRPAEEYGLSLILGGAEGTLYDITRIYATMAAIAMGYDNVPGTDVFPLDDRMAIYCTLDALKEVNRPDEMDWRSISSVRRVAWKTGTSYGFRDGWAVGVSPDYAIGVWAGNAPGQGCPGLTGARTAGPVMFDLFNLLPASGWFPEPPYGEYTEAEVCRLSGHLKSIFCQECDTVKLPLNAMRSQPCPYHRNDGSFSLPPVMEWFYRTHHPEYDSGRRQAPDDIPMQFIYPEYGSTIHLPRQLDGSKGKAVFQLAHRNPGTTIFWHLDDSYIGSTKFIHQMSVSPEPGHHSMTAVDSSGNTVSVGFDITDR